MTDYETQAILQEQLLDNDIKRIIMKHPLKWIKLEKTNGTIQHYFFDTNEVYYSARILCTTWFPCEAKSTLKHPNMTILHK